MRVAKLFSNGSSQAVRLPKECRFPSREREVYVHKLNGMVLLISKKEPWKPFVESLGQFSDKLERSQPGAYDRRETMA